MQLLKNLPANAGGAKDVGSIPRSGRSSGAGHGNPLQYSCLENPMDKGAWQAAVHRATKSWARLKRLSMHACRAILTGLGCVLVLKLDWPHGVRAAGKSGEES